MVSALGTAASGQDWEDSGNWAIEETEQPYALFGNAIELPFYYAEDTTAYVGGSHINIPYFDSTPKRMGDNGSSSVAAKTLYIDRPTLIECRAWANVTNDTTGGGAESFNVRFFIGIEWGGTTYYGRQQNTWTGVGDNTGTPRPQRLCATAHQEFVDPGDDPYVQVDFWWAYQQDSASMTSNNILLRNQKMEILTTYAPDFSVDVDGDPVFTTKKRPLWTKFGINRTAYRAIQGNDFP